MPMNQTVINNLYRLLKRKDLTPHAFAIKYSMNVRTVTNIFQGKCNPRTDTLEQIAECFNTTVAELYEEKDKEISTIYKNDLKNSIHTSRDVLWDIWIGWMMRQNKKAFTT